MNTQTNIMASIRAAKWHEAHDARAILAEIVDNPPRWVPAALPDIITGRIVYQYDRNDSRVARLEAFASGWFACCGSFDLTVDEVIGRARAECRRKEAEQARFDALMADGLTLGEARAAIWAGDLPASLEA